MSVTHDSQCERAGGYLLATLIVVTIIGVLIVLGVLGARRRHDEYVKAENDRRASLIADIKAGRCRQPFVYDVEFLVQIAGDPACVAKIDSLVLATADLSDERWSQLKALTNLSDLGFYSCSDADEFLERVQGMPSIQSISVETTGISEKGIRLLGTFPYLKRVHFEQVMTRKEIDLLRTTLSDAELRLPFPDPRIERDEEIIDREAL